MTPGLLDVLSPCHISTPALFQASSCYSGPRCALYPMWTHLLTLESPPQQQFLLSSRIQQFQGPAQNGGTGCHPWVGTGRQEDCWPSSHRAGRAGVPTFSQDRVVSEHLFLNGKLWLVPPTPAVLAHTTEVRLRQRKQMVVFSLHSISQTLGPQRPRETQT